MEKRNVLKRIEVRRIKHFFLKFLIFASRMCRCGSDTAINRRNIYACEEGQLHVMHNFVEDKIRINASEFVLFVCVRKFTLSNPLNQFLILQHFLHHQKELFLEIHPCVHPSFLSNRKHQTHQHSSILSNKEK